MFHRIQQYALLEADGRWYRPRAYGDPQPDGGWKGWLIFFPLLGGGAIAPPHAETTQATWTALITWAAGLTPVYLEGALERALTVTAEPAALISHLAAAEYDALEDAERLETAADVQRAVADLDDAAADAARREGDELRRERLAAERALAAAAEVAATAEAAAHEQAAHDARDAADRAKRRRRSAEAAAAPPGKRKDGAAKKK